MNIRTDSCFKIGNNHRVCEDYILHGNDPFPHIILSDGCSSSLNSDIGARILVHQTKQVLMQISQNELGVQAYDIIRTSVLTSAKNIATNMGVPWCLDATLIIAFYQKNTGQLLVFMYGDGYIFTKHNNMLTSINIEYAKQAPYYPSYQLEQDRHAAYKELVGETPVLETLWKSEIETTREHHLSRKNIYSFYPLPGDIIAISSDGVGSFYSISNKLTAPTTDILINDILSFKNTNGEFVRRRIEKMIRTYDKQGIKHFDDISVGAFAFSEDCEETKDENQCPPN